MFFLDCIHTHTHSHAHMHTRISAAHTPHPSLVKWIVGHFVALWEILSQEPVALLSSALLSPTLPLLFTFPLSLLPASSAASFTCHSKVLAPPSYPPSLIPLPLRSRSLHRTTHYLQEDASQCEALRSSSPLLASSLLMPKIPSSSSLLPPIPTPHHHPPSRSKGVNVTERRGSETPLRCVLLQTNAECQPRSLLPSPFICCFVLFCFFLWGARRQEVGLGRAAQGSHGKPCCNCLAF